MQLICTLGVSKQNSRSYKSFDLFFYILVVSMINFLKTSFLLAGSRALFVRFHGFCEFFPNCLWNCLDSSKSLLKDLVWIRGQGLKSKVHFCFGRMWDAVSNKLNIRMAREDDPEDIAKSMILITKHVSGATSIIFLLKYIMFILSVQSIFRFDRAKWR